MNNSKIAIKPDAITISQSILSAGKELRAAGILEYKSEARILARHAFSISEIELITKASNFVDLRDIAHLQTCITRRLTGEPVGRITGITEFYGNKFHISEGALDPRSDTETLIDVVLTDWQGSSLDTLRILDIGTGSGAIIISLLNNLPNARGIASDISLDALKVAKINAEEQLVAERVTFVETRWCHGIEGKFDVIVSNPPYIKTETIPTLAREVKDHDPIISLDGGMDGLDAYRNIFSQCADRLLAGGKLYLEIGFDQKDAVCELARLGAWTYEHMEKDIGGNDRVLVFSRR